MDNEQRPLLVPPWFRDLLVKAAQQLSLFDESKVARQPRGPKGGQFAPKGGGKPATNLFGEPERPAPKTEEAPKPKRRTRRRPARPSGNAAFEPLMTDDGRGTIVWKETEGGPMSILGFSGERRRTLTRHIGVQVGDKVYTTGNGGRDEVQSPEGWRPVTPVWLYDNPHSENNVRFYQRDDTGYPQAGGGEAAEVAPAEDVEPEWVAPEAPAASADVSSQEALIATLAGLEHNYGSGWGDFSEVDALLEEAGYDWRQRAAFRTGRQRIVRTPDSIKQDLIFIGEPGAKADIYKKANEALREAKSRAEKTGQPHYYGFDSARGGVVVSDELLPIEDGCYQVRPDGNRKWIMPGDAEWEEAKERGPKRPAPEAKGEAEPASSPMYETVVPGPELQALSDEELETRIQDLRERGLATPYASAQFEELLADIRPLQAERKRRDWSGVEPAQPAPEAKGKEAPRGTKAAMSKLLRAIKDSAAHRGATPAGLESIEHKGEWLNFDRAVVDAALEQLEKDGKITYDDNGRIWPLSGVRKSPRLLVVFGGRCRP